MKKSFGLLFLVILVPVLIWAAAPQKASLTPLPGPSQPMQLNVNYSEYNDGWIDVFKVPIVGTDAVDLRGRRTLDAFDSTFFLDDFEGGYAMWTAEDLTDVPQPFPYWHLDDTLAWGGTGQAWYCADSNFSPGAGGGYDNHQLHYLISDTLDLTSAATPITLAFKARWKIETPGTSTSGGCTYNLWDTWNVWVSTNLGETWTVTTPTSPAYTGTSSYAFGKEFEMGCNIPGYGGTQASYVDCIFSLSGLAGQDSVLIRWAFCSDPAQCTSDDATLFGLIIDSIRVTDASRAVLLSNNGEADEFTSVAGFTRPPPSGITWEYLTGDDPMEYHSANHSWHAAVDTNLLQMITSPEIVLPTGYDLVRVRYWVYCDMPDYDGDNDGGLDDLFDFWIHDVDSATDRRIIYDWAKDFGNPPPDGNSALGWVRRSQAAHSGTGGYTLDDINLTAWAGRTVQIMFRHNTDDNDDGGVGQGLYIDDVELWCSRAYQIDMATRNFNFKFPTTVGLTQSYNYQLYNAGLTSIGNQLRHRIRFYRPNGTQWFDSSLVPGVTLLPGRDTTLYRNWTPAVSGSFRMWVYGTYTGDEDLTNDTTRTPVNVPLNADSNLAVTVRPAGQYELAYHLREMGNAFLNPRYVRYTPSADGVPSDSLANGFDVTTVRVVWQFDADIADSSATSWIEFWSDSLADHPGHLLKRFVTEIDTNETVGATTKVRWWTLDVSGTPELTGLHGNFWISVTSKDSINGGPDPLPMGKSVDPVVYDGHSFVVRLDSLNAFRPSPGRYLIQTTIKPNHTPGTVHNLVVRRDGETNDIILNWSATAFASGYKVYRLTNVSYGYSQGTLLTPTPISATTYTDSGIIGTATTKYYYLVIAAN